MFGADCIFTSLQADLGNQLGRVGIITSKQNTRFFSSLIYLRLLNLNLVVKTSVSSDDRDEVTLRPTGSAACDRLVSTRSLLLAALRCAPKIRSYHLCRASFGLPLSHVVFEPSSTARCCQLRHA
uniref:(northern house mosquito) hypothetical protein n=1 Tax=Culex pipiens TaxID=7175 RepID=A0A8D8CRE9_CULPI